MKIKLEDKKWVTENYQKLFWILEHDPRFEKSIKRIRSKFKKSKKISDEELAKLLDDFNMPQSMFREIKSFIIEDSMPALFLEPGIELQALGLTKEVMLGKSSPIGKKREVKIIITKKVTKNELIKWVEENWDSILFDMLTLELPDTKIPRWENFELAKQIIELREIQKLTFSEITDKLKLSDEDYIKTLYHRYKKWFK